MAIKAVFPAGKTEVTTEKLHQWDYGQQLEIEASYLPPLIEAQFACKGMDEAITHVCSVDTTGFSHVATVTIPNACLEQANPITVWVYQYTDDGTSGNTIGTITIPLTARTRPCRSREIPQTISDRYTELISEVEELVESMGAGDIIISYAERANHANSAGTANAASLATNATNDLHGRPIHSTYHSLAGGEHMIELTSGSLDNVRDPGTYFISYESWSTDNVVGLPTDIRLGKGCAILTVEVDKHHSLSRVYQTLRFHTTAWDANMSDYAKRCLVYNRDIDWWDGIEGEKKTSPWRRLVSAEEIASGALFGGSSWVEAGTENRLPSFGCYGIVVILHEDSTDLILNFGIVLYDSHFKKVNSHVVFLHATPHSLDIEGDGGKVFLVRNTASPYIYLDSEITVYYKKFWDM